jgi:hypothetical protein
VQTFTYNLEKVVIDPYRTFGQTVGITVAAVPEPSGIALLVAAVAVSATLRAYQRCRAQRNA